MNKVGIGSCLGLFFLSVLLIMLLELISFCKDSDTVKPHWFQWCPERVLTTKVKCSMSCLIFKNLNQMKKRRKAGSNDLIDLISELSLFSLVVSHPSRYFFTNQFLVWFSKNLNNQSPPVLIQRTLIFGCLNVSTTLNVYSLKQTWNICPTSHEYLLKSQFSCYTLYKSLYIWGNIYNYELWLQLSTFSWFSG